MRVKANDMISTRNRQLWAFLLLVITTLLLAQTGEAREHISMYIGEVKVLEIGGIDRVAIGNPKVASNTILPQGQLVLLADAEGTTTMHIWLKNGEEKDFDVVVIEKRALDSHQELVRLLSDIKMVTVEKIGEMSVVKGTVSPAEKADFDRIMAHYPEVLNLVKARDTVADISQLLGDIPGISIREVGGYSVISGQISQEYDELVKIIEDKYANVLNLTRIHEVVAGKMVYMKVRIMEMNKKLTENLGIDWGIFEGITGPSLEFGVETVSRGSTILNSTKGVPESLKKSGNQNLTTSAGYFGIATGIGSIINLFEGTGDAVILAEPRLSARSGGTAEFLAGGEFPVPVTNSLGSTDVEFKKYGISLHIAPVVDDQGNIVAHVDTEISMIDDVEVHGIPGVLTRRTNTDVSLRAEQTLVIAGLIQDKASINYNKVKWLGELPVLGALFRSEKFLNDQTELVIFITPSIYDASSEHNAVGIQKGAEIYEHYEEIIGGRKLLE